MDMLIIKLLSNQSKVLVAIKAVITKELIVIQALIKFPNSLHIYLYLHVRNTTHNDEIVFNCTKRHNYVQHVLTLIQKLVESALSIRANTTRVKRHTPIKTVIKPRAPFRSAWGIIGVKISMKTFDVTDTVQKHYPGVSDLQTETEFTDYLNDKGIKVSPEQLRQYRHRDLKFCYIKRGNGVFYPKFINEIIVREMIEDKEGP